MVLEPGIAVPDLVGLRDPELHPLQRPAVGAGVLLGVDDAPSRGHQVHLARADQLLRAEAVAVQDSALHQPRDRLQPRVRVRADVEPSGLGDLGRAHVVGEAPGADRAQPAARQDAAHLHPPDLGSGAVVDLDRHGPSVSCPQRGPGAPRAAHGGVSRRLPRARQAERLGVPPGGLDPHRDAAPAASQDTALRSPANAPGDAGARPRLSAGSRSTRWDTGAVAGATLEV